MLDNLELIVQEKMNIQQKFHEIDFEARNYPRQHERILSAKRSNIWIL